MDIFSHLLWGNLEYRLIPQTKHDNKLIYGGIFFSIFPDLIAFTYPFCWLIWHRFIQRDLKHWPGSPAEYEALPCAALTYKLYRVSHSLVVWLVVFCLVWKWIGFFPWVLLGWATHILIDIPTHTKGFFATPFLWPISKFTINGYAWDNRDFMAFNIMVIIMAYLVFIYA